MAGFVYTLHFGCQAFTSCVLSEWCCCRHEHASLQVLLGVCMSGYLCIVQSSNASSQLQICLCRIGFGHDKARAVHAEHGLMYEDTKHHQKAVFYYKLGIMTACHHSTLDPGNNVNALLMGIAEACDAEWQDTGLHLLDFCGCHAFASPSRQTTGFVLCTAAYDGVCCPSSATPR